MAAIYLSEAQYEAMMDVTIDASSIPSTTNFEAVENYLGNFLNGSLVIDSAVTSTVALSIAKFHTGLMIQAFSAWNQGDTKGLGVEDYTKSPQFIELWNNLEPMRQAIRNCMDTEKDPAWIYDMRGWGGAVRL